MTTPEEILKKVRDIPPLPDVVLRILKLSNDPDSSAKDLVEVGQDFDGCVSCLSAKGVFVKVDHGLEGLLQIENGPGSLEAGAQLQVRVINFDPERERLDLELIE